MLSRVQRHLDARSHSFKLAFANQRMVPATEGSTEPIDGIERRLDHLDAFFTKRLGNLGQLSINDHGLVIENQSVTAKSFMGILVRTRR